MQMQPDGVIETAINLATTGNGQVALIIIGRQIDTAVQLQNAALFPREPGHVLPISFRCRYMCNQER
jgi:hypothetical protein